MANKNQKNKNNKAKQVNVNKTNKDNTKINKANVEAEKEIIKEEKKVASKVEKIETEKKEVVKENNKKQFKLTSTQKDVILVLLVVVLLIVAFIVTGTRNPKLDVELPLVLEGESGFTEITYDEYEAKLSEEKAFLVAIVKDGCSYCEMYEPILEDVSDEYNLPIYYINLTNLSEDEYNALSKSNSYLKKEQWGTPTTLLMYGDIVVDSIGGYVEKDEFIKQIVEDNIKVEEDAE